MQLWVYIFGLLLSYDKFKKGYFRLLQRDDKNMIRLHNEISDFVYFKYPDILKTTMRFKRNFIDKFKQ